eukprot:s726_g12.t1
MPHFMMQSEGAHREEESPTEMLDLYADDEAPSDNQTRVDVASRLAETRLVEARESLLRLTEARKNEREIERQMEKSKVEDRVHTALLRFSEARQAEPDRLTRQAEPDRPTRRAEPDRPTRRVWILFRGDTVPLPLDDLSFAQEMRLEQGWPYTYEKFTVAWYYWTAAFLLWIAMPLTMLFLAKDATCEGGPPSAGYVMYGLFLTAHVALMIIAVAKSPKKVSFCDCSKDFFLWGPILVFFLILDHMDMATDAMFVGSAAACTDRISWQYQSSWEAIPWAGDELAFTIQELNFSGLVLFCFISFVYIPQLTGQAPFFALITTTLCAFGMYLTLHWGSLAGLHHLLKASFCFEAQYPQPTQGACWIEMDCGLWGSG